MAIAPVALGLALASAFLGLLGYVHHDGHQKGYRKHEIEVSEAVRATNRRIAELNARTAEVIARAERNRDAAFEAANAQTATVSGCVLPEELRLSINKVSKR